MIGDATHSKEPGDVTSGCSRDWRFSCFASLEIAHAYYHCFKCEFLLFNKSMSHHAKSYHIALILTLDFGFFSLYLIFQDVLIIYSAGSGFSIIIICIITFIFYDYSEFIYLLFIIMSL